MALAELEAPPYSVFNTRSRSSSVSTTSSSVALPTFEALAPPRAPTTTVSEETVLEIPFLNQDVKLKVDAGPGCGGITWPSGIVLSRYLAWKHSHSPDLLAGKTIVELGSGTGLVGIVAALLEPSAHVYATDQAQLLDLMKVNAELNVDTPNIHIAEYDWGETPAGIPIEKADIVLAADCVYFEPAFPLLVQTLCDLAPVGKDIEILFCWKKRRKADKRFFIMLRKHFDSEVVDDDKPGERETYQRQGVALLRLKRRK